jgi:hypothetical protein
MTSSGRRWAFLFGVLVAFALPKKIERGQHPGDLRSVCTEYDVEPWGFSLLEQVVGRPVGFTYSTGEDCR